MTGTTASAGQPAGTVPSASAGQPAGTAPPAAEGLTHRLVSWAAGLRYDDIPVHARDRAKDLLIDAVACALAADDAEEMAQIAALAGHLGSAGTSTVIGGRGGRPAAVATLLNGYRITALTSCDVYAPARFHVTPEVVPPALAVAERDHGSGRDLLVALVAGFELATRIAAAMDYASLRPRGWHTPGVVGPLGGAAAAGLLLGLDERGLRHALGIAASQSSGTWASWGTPTVKFHQARAALAALMAATLASTGFAASDTVLEHPDGGLLTTYAGGGRPERATDGLGDAWELEQISLRPWPGATPVQPVITGLFTLLRQGSLPTTSPGAIRISVNPVVHEQHARFVHPQGTFEAMLSIHYAAAAIALWGRLGFAEFQPRAYADERLATVIDRVIEVTPDPKLGPLQCRVVVETADGTRVQDVAAPLGNPDNPAPRAVLAAKFTACATGSLGDRTAQVLDMLGTLEAVPDVAVLCELLRPGGAVGQGR